MRGGHEKGCARFFRLADVDGKQTMTRSKFLQILALVRPSLRLEHIRKKLRSHYNKMLNKIRSVNRQARLYLTSY